MRVAAVTMAAGVLLGGCATKNRASRVTVPSNQMQPVLERQILNAVDAGEGNPRVRELRETIAEEPQNVKARVNLAVAYNKAGFPELELEHLRLAVERFPESDLAVVALARALVRVERHSEAALHLRVYLSKQENPPATVLSWAGIANDRLGKYQDGESLHRRAIARSPGRDPLHNNLGYNLMMQGRSAEAAESFRRALELNPASDTARNNLGLALGDQPAAAITHFRQTADQAIAHNNLAAYLYEKGDVAGARRELELALDYRKDMPRILENLRKISALDGMPIQMPRQENRSLWRSFTRGLKQTFIASGEKHSSGTAEAGR
jgi:Flp pilus assembly protein TadD